MGKLFEQVEDAWMGQILKNEANHIFTKVEAARKAATEAGNRWPFEILQNAEDGGCRAGRPSIAVEFWFEKGDDKQVLRVRHDGAPFTPADLTALLSGGSSKERESSETTGRFGTGFLVTHVLASSVRIRGVASCEGDLMDFDVQLRRGGNEADILANMEECRTAVQEAKPIATLDDDRWTAEFEYLLPDPRPFWDGIEMLRATLPYLFGTCPRLGAVTVPRADGGFERWTASDVSRRDVEGGHLGERTVRRSPREGVPDAYKTSRYTSSPGGAEAVLLIATQSDLSGWRLLPPPPGVPRVFHRFPLRGMTWVPLDVVLDGTFPPDQERHHILWEASKDRIRAALDLLPCAVLDAVNSRMEQGFLSARVADPTKGLAAPDAERTWWKAELQRTSERLAVLRIIPTDSGVWGAVKDADEECRFVDFPVPRLRLSLGPVDVAFDRVWRLMHRTDYFDVPPLEIAEAWSRIACGWSDLGVPLQLRSLQEIGAIVFGRARLLVEVTKVADPVDWLREYLDVVGEAWAQRGSRDLDLLKGMLPDQTGMLHSPGDLERDDGIAEDLKDIAEGLGLAPRSGLLDRHVLADVDPATRRYLGSTVHAVTRGTRSATSVVEECLSRLDAGLPSGGKPGSAPEAWVRGSLALLGWLWANPVPEARGWSRRVPLVTREGTLQRVTAPRKVMAPVSAWPEQARPFAAAWPPSWVHDDRYADPLGSRDDTLVDALAAWDLAFPGLTVTVTPNELKERRLAAAAVDPATVAGVTVREQPFVQIPLLESDIIARCTSGEDGDEVARALLGFVVRYLAEADTSWDELVECRGRREGADVAVRLRSALWVADLKSRPWVPVVHDGERTLDHPTETTIDDLLDPAWLTDNPAGIRFLETCFGFDGLSLRLRGLSSDGAERKKVRDQLAALVDATAGQDAGATLTTLADIAALARETGADATELAGIRDRLRERNERSARVKTWRAYGIAVQDAVRDALRRQDLRVEPKDHGLDFEVYIMDGVEPEAIARFGVGPYLVEVKATTASEVRMTHAQAEKASEFPDRYALCVVRIPADATGLDDRAGLDAQVVERARFVPDIGHRVSESFGHVRAAADPTDDRQVGIRNESALRYAVDDVTWNEGIGLDGWVGSILGTLATQETAPATQGGVTGAMEPSTP